MRRQKRIEKEWILSFPIEQFVSKRIPEVPEERVLLLLDLFQQRCETAYICRYREEVHGGMSPERIRKAKDAYLYAFELNSRVHTAIGKITENRTDKAMLVERLKQCENVDEVTDIEKKFAIGAPKSKAQLAREFGLESPARSILKGCTVDFQEYLSGDLKTTDEVQDYTKALLAELINEEPEVRQKAVEIATLKTKCSLWITARWTNDANKFLKKSSKTDEEIRNATAIVKKYKYFIQDWNAAVIRDHTLAALNRGVEENILNWDVVCHSEQPTAHHPLSELKVHSEMQSFFEDALNHSIENNFVKMLERAVKRHLNLRSRDRGISVFGKNVELLFDQEGIQNKYVISLDPGGKVKAAFLDPTGRVLGMDEFRILEWFKKGSCVRDSAFDDRGVSLLLGWSKRSNRRDIVFAIGNGSKSYCTQVAVSKMIQMRKFPRGINVFFCIVPENGASQYSCTAIAREEFGADSKIKQLSAVSIGRRLINPMSELVKIPPQHLGQGQYQMSLRDVHLEESLNGVVRDKVSQNGVNVNTARKELLEFVNGLDGWTAQEIVEYRETHGQFQSREDLKKVNGVDSHTFQQCAGFLTVSRPENASSSSWSPLDETIVHPDDYHLALKVLQDNRATIDEIQQGRKIPSSTPEVDRIVKLLSSKPELQPPPPLLKKTVAIEDLCVGQELIGTVSNLTDFGVFMDIGVEFKGMIPMDYFRDLRKECARYQYINIKEHDILEFCPPVGKRITVRIEKYEAESDFNQNRNEIDLERIKLRPFWEWNCATRQYKFL